MTASLPPRRLSYKLLLPLCFTGLVVLGGVLALAAQARHDAVRQAGVATGSAVAKQTVALRSFYTTQIASRALKSGMRLGFDYAQQDSMLPLPATMVKVLGEDIARQYPGSDVKLKSNFPFPNRTAEESRLDAFQSRALAALEKEPKAPVYSIEPVGGRLSVRYAVADVMKEGCVACHNSHPQSPKKDWKVGDVRGLVEVVIPVDELDDSITRQTLLICALVSAGFGAIGLMLFVLARRYMSRPLDEVTRLMDGVAKGDLTVKAPAGGTREIDLLFRSLDTMVQKVHHTMRQVRESVDNIQVASAEVAGGTADLGRRTETAASGLQQTTSSMAGLAEAVQHSAASASAAHGLAGSAAEVAQRGGQVAARVASTMDDIHASSTKIADIISVIDGIAFQTNILALNAAVEAARAGEQGRGFAVVAGEVRALAQRSAQAAKEIKSLIDNSVGKVETGTRLVQDAGATMDEIVASVQRVSEVIGDISKATAEQSDNIGRINLTVTELDQTTLQNSALVEQSTAAAESLKEQATRLAALVAMFRLTR